MFLQEAIMSAMKSQFVNLSISLIFLTLFHEVAFHDA